MKIPHIKIVITLVFAAFSAMGGGYYFTIGDRQFSRVLFLFSLISTAVGVLWMLVTKKADPLLK